MKMTFHLGLLHIRVILKGFASCVSIMKLKSFLVKMDLKYVQNRKMTRK